MTNEERDLITQFIQRVAGAPARAGSVPATAAHLMQRHPEARYRLAQTAFVQEHALAEAQNTINRLQWELDQARAQPMPTQPTPAPSPWGAAAQAPQQPRGLFGGMFAGRPSAPPPPGMGRARTTPPPPSHAPGYQPGMFQRQGGSGFLGSALTTAAGVAGGLVVGNMLMNAFSGGNAAQAADSSPWTNPTGATDPAPQDTWQDAGHHDEADTGWTDAGIDDEF